MYDLVKWFLFTNKCLYKNFNKQVTTVSRPPIFCDEAYLNNIETGFILIDLRDHCPIIAWIPIPKYDHQNSNKIRNINYGSINYYLEKKTWDCVYNEINIEILVKNIYNKLNCIIEKYTSD
jgi:hypothetical protein